MGSAFETDIDLLSKINSDCKLKSSLDHFSGFGSSNRNIEFDQNKTKLAGALEFGLLIFL